MMIIICVDLKLNTTGSQLFSNLRLIAGVYSQTLYESYRRWNINICNEASAEEHQRSGFPKLHRNLLSNVSEGSFQGISWSLYCFIGTRSLICCKDDDLNVQAACTRSNLHCCQDSPKLRLQKCYCHTYFIIFKTPLQELWQLFTSFVSLLWSIFTCYTNSHLIITLCHKCLQLCKPTFLV